MKTVAQQRYPPEPPLSFPPPDREMTADQPYPPSPPLSFPPPVQLADQLYPPEPPLSSLPLVNEPSVDARGLRAEAQALGLEDMTSLSVGHAKAVQSMDLTQVYGAGALFLLVAGLVMLVGTRRRESNRQQAREQSVTFSDSYEPFLG